LKSRAFYDVLRHHEKDLNYMPSGETIEMPRFLTSVNGFDETLKGGSPQGQYVVVQEGPRLEEALHKTKPVFPFDFLERFVNEGLPQGSNVSLMGPPGVGKTVFCENLAKTF